MSKPERTFSGTQIVATIVVGLYGGGYAAIRANCENFGNGLSKVPSCISTGGSRTALYTLYKPLFFAEKRLTGHQFTWSPWAMPDL